MIFVSNKKSIINCQLSIIMQLFQYKSTFELECGEVVPSLTVAYHTYGQLNSDRSNVVWVCHALTASSDVADWWPGTVVEGGLLDPTRYFVVCANCLGSCYGTTTPTTRIPDFTIRDMARAHSLLADHLGIDKVAHLIGGSTGGAQAMEWAYSEPERFGRLSLIATMARTSAWVQAASESQRMAIEADPVKGLAAARTIAMLQYRGREAYVITQTDPDQSKLHDFQVTSYQRYQGEKLVRRFEVESYVSLLNSLDSHNIGRGRGGVEAALSTIKIPTMVIAISSDILFPPSEVKAIADAMPNARYVEIDSPYGHDGFLIETPAISSLLL